MPEHTDTGRTERYPGKVPMRMNKKEIEQLHKSADALKEVIAQINLD